MKVWKKNETEVVLRLSPNMICNSNNEVANLRKVFANNLLANIMLSKTQLSKMIQSGGLFGRLLIHY